MAKRKTPSTVGGLKAAAYNPRKIEAQAEAGLERSMAEFGDLSSLVYCVQSDRLVCGHQRKGRLPSSAKIVRTEDVTDETGTVGYGYIEAKKTRWPVRFVDWDEAKEKAANVAANSPALAGEFTDALGPLLDEIREADEDLFAGLRLGEIEIPTSPEPDAGTADAEPQIDRAAEINKKWKVKAGDLWTLGEHRLLCGDSTKPDDVARVMNGDVCVCAVLDPPYGVDVVGRNGKVGGDNAARCGVYSAVVGDKSTDTARLCYGACVAVGIQSLGIWGGNYFTDFLPPSPCWLVWDKRGDMASNNFADCELMWTSLSKPARVHKQTWCGMIREGESEGRVHPTQKPVATVQVAIEMFGESAVFDGFLGSGTTMVAAENLQRRCYGIEIAPEYCAVILERMASAFPGIKIERDRR